MIIINSHIARINNVVGYNNTISRGDIVLLNDDAYVVTYILKQEIESISPTIRCNYILLISSESFSNLPKVLPMVHPDKYHANFKEELLNLYDNYVKIVTERDDKISKALSNVKSI